MYVHVERVVQGPDIEHGIDVVACKVFSVKWIVVISTDLGGLGEGDRQLVLASRRGLGLGCHLSLAEAGRGWLWLVCSGCVIQALLGAGAPESAEAASMLATVVWSILEGMRTS